MASYPRRLELLPPLWELQILYSCKHVYSIFVKQIFVLKVLACYMVYVFVKACLILFWTYVLYIISNDSNCYIHYILHLYEYVKTCGEDKCERVKNKNQIEALA
jgi:hypothetical protein